MASGFSRNLDMANMVNKGLAGFIMKPFNRVELSKIIYDHKLHVVHNALGLHSYVGRNQGGKLRTKNELRVSSVFKKAPEAFLNMIVVHELAHLKEKEHGKAFYRLCQHMLPDYYQLEFDTRLYLIQLDLEGSIYNTSS